MEEKRESCAALDTAELIDGGWLVLKVEDELIQDANFPEGILASKLAESEELQYNLTRRCFGYGSDVMDWENAGEEWVEFEEMDVAEDGKLLLYFEDKEVRAEELGKCEVCGHSIHNEDETGYKEHHHVCDECGDIFFYESEYLKHIHQHQIGEKISK